MPTDRRDFLKRVGFLTAAGAGALTGSQAMASGPGHTAAGGHGAAALDPMGVLVDLTACIGCRACERACLEADGRDPGPIEAYDDPSVFQEHRRPGDISLTVVNSFDRKDQPGKSLYAKVNCVHCNHPACVSACIVGALRKQPSGAVTYDAWKCIGCRYCMVACPMQLPAYEYDNVLTPQVRKCQFCEARTKEGQLPACMAACPQNAMRYGKRSELLELAHAQIREHPGRYVDHVYGEHEVGGTSWMYLSPVPFEEAGFLKLGNAAPPVLTEAIQHGVFKYWIAPVGWYGFLASMMWWTGRKSAMKAAAAASSVGSHAVVRPQAPLHVGEAVSPAAAGVGGETALRQSAVLAAVDGVRSEDWHDSAATPEHRVEHSHGHGQAAPVGGRLLTPGVWALIALVAVGVAFWFYRMAVGLGASTNLDQQHPWGLWIAMDVGSGIALAGGGFMTAALVHIFHREKYHAVARSALLTALLGYTFYVPGLLADIGRWYNIWHPTLPNMWQVNSVLFEVGICVMLYLNVQYAELAPIICERFMGGSQRRPGLARWVRRIHDGLERIMPALLVLGVTLSTFHQSSLGNLMVIAPYKLHILWWTPVSPLLFLLSAMMVGFPMVIFTMLFASWSLNRRPEMDVLGSLARLVPVFLAVYLVVKIGDVAVRGVAPMLLDGSVESLSWLAEVGLGVVLPMVLLLRPRVRQSPGPLAGACLAVILGVVLNRLNVFVIAYDPPYATRDYFPSFTEFAVSAGLVAALLLTYRVAVTYLPILEPRPKAA